MTTIAWDGKTVAADWQCGFHKTQVPKIERVKGGIAGGAGQSNLCAMIPEYFNDERDRLKYRQAADQIDKDVTILRVIDEDSAELWMHGTYGAPRIVHPPFAIGSGSEYAMGAMAMGASAAEAVKVAHRFDQHTGREVDVLFVGENPNEF